MVLSKGCIYAIQAAIYIASADSSTGVPSPVIEDPADETWRRHRPSVSVGEISSALNISFHFLTKILQQLTSANLTHSHRGPNGGIALARPANEISLFDIIVAVDGPGLFLDCLLRPGYCGENGTCTAHVVWEPIRKKFMESAKRTTVAALAETTRMSSIGDDLHASMTPNAHRADDTASASVLGERAARVAQHTVAELTREFATTSLVEHASIGGSDDEEHATRMSPLASSDGPSLAKREEVV